MLRIALCDDEEVFLEHESKIISEYLKQKGLSYAVECFPSGESLLADKDRLDTFDLVILDVEMTGIDGVSVAKIICEHNRKVNIAFTSQYMNYSTDGYHVRAVRYILKNSEDLEDYLHECLDRVLETIDQNDREITLDFTIGKRTLKISDIVYLKSARNYTTFVVSYDTKEIYSIRGTLKKATDIMRVFDFISVSAKETVNLAHVRSMSRYSVSLDNGIDIPVSQKKYNDAFRAYTLYRGRNL